MSAIAAVLEQQKAARARPEKVQPLAGSSQPANGSGDAGSSSATITANDFLTLLVTEMQNQDPTANTDPNEYINQLVQVNSLEQLININQTLSTALPPASSTTGQAAPQSAAQSGVTGLQTPAAAAPGKRTAIPQNSPAPVSPSAFGNLSAPVANPSALRVAHALDGSPTAAVSAPLGALR